MQQYKYINCSKYCDHLNKFCDFELTYQLVQHVVEVLINVFLSVFNVLITIHATTNVLLKNPLNELLIGRSFFEFIRQIIYLYFHI